MLVLLLWLFILLYIHHVLSYFGRNCFICTFSSIFSLFIYYFISLFLVDSKIFASCFLFFLIYNVCLFSGAFFKRYFTRKHLASCVEMLLKSLTSTTEMIYRDLKYKNTRNTRISTNYESHNSHKSSWNSHKKCPKLKICKTLVQFYTNYTSFGFSSLLILILFIFHFLKSISVWLEHHR